MLRQCRFYLSRPLDRRLLNDLKSDLRADSSYEEPTLSPVGRELLVKQEVPEGANTNPFALVKGFLADKDISFEAVARPLAA